MPTRTLLLTLASLVVGCSAPIAPAVSSDATAPPTMLIADVRIAIRADALGAFTEAIGPFVEASRRADGNLAFDLLRLDGDDARFVLLERWESQAAFDAYLASDAFAAFRTDVGPLLAGPPESAYYAARVADRETVR